MKKLLSPVVCAAALLTSTVSIDALLAPAYADMDIDFDTIHDQLAPYGDWVYSDRWGEVWIPENVSDDFQPYGTNGYWADTDDYGWLWVSNYEWGDIPFHYGRWVNDPDIGWLWIPGYVWSPAWVVWRTSGEYTGWMPMPPDREFLGVGGPSLGIGLALGGGINIGIDFNDTSSYYGYSQWYGRDYDEDRFARNWVFVGTGHLADRDFRRYWAPRDNNTSIFRNTTNITNYRVVNNYIVNRGVDPRVVERAGGRPVPKVAIAQVVHNPQFVMHANQGMQIQNRMRSINPRGTGLANSAPAPSPKLVQGLSNNVPQRGGHAPVHLFSKTTVTTAPAFTGKRGGNAMMQGGAGGAMQGGTMQGGTMQGGTMQGGAGGTMQGPNARKEKVHAPSDLGGPATMTSPNTMQGPSTNRHTEKFTPPSETGGSMSNTMQGPAANTMQGPAGNTMTREHKHMPASETGTAPNEMGATPQTRTRSFNENTMGAGGESGGGRQHNNTMNAAPPPVVHKAPPAEQAPPAKPEEKKKKEKPQ